MESLVQWRRLLAAADLER